MLTPVSPASYPPFPYAGHQSIEHAKLRGCGAAARGRAPEIPGPINGDKHDA